MIGKEYMLTRHTEKINDENYDSLVREIHKIKSLVKVTECNKKLFKKQPVLTKIKKAL